MSRENLRQTLDAVETALEQLAASLEQAGFSAGADTYSEMAGVVIGQRLWAKTEGVDEFDDRFSYVGRLAERVHGQLHPYVSVMERLASLGALTEGSVPDVRPDSLAGRIQDVLLRADGPLSATAIRSQAGSSTVDVRRELDALSEQGIVRRMSAGSRPKYALVGRAQSDSE